MLLISLFQVHTCTTKLLEIETALRFVSVCVCVFFLLFIKTCFKCCLVLPNNYSQRPSSPERSCGWRGGGGRKERLELRLWNLNICMEKVDEKCWLADMTLIMTSLPLAPFFVSTFCWLAEIWQLIRRGATGELEVEFKFQRRNCKLSLIFPPCRQSAIESLLANYA